MAINDTIKRIEAYRGTGGYEGYPELAGINKPLLLGRCRRIKPTRISLDKFIYQVSASKIDAVTAVYTNGMKLKWQTVYADDLFSEACDRWCMYLVDLYIENFIVVDLVNGSFRSVFPIVNVLCDAEESTACMNYGYHRWGNL